jgi:peptidoglycan/LPS O-acetylase OafA/YrhL
MRVGLDGGPRPLGHRVELDGLRGIAILLVLLVHFYYPVFSGGGSGVELFFVLSGFLITKLAFEEHERRGFLLRDFYTRRFFRIAPALAVLLVALVISSYTWLSDIGGRVRSEVIFAATAAGNTVALFHGAVDRPTLGHSWSLAIEEQFYFVWPLILVIYWKSRRTPRDLVRYVLIVSLALFAVGRGVVWGLLGYEHWSSIPFINSDGIMLGCVMAIQYHTSDRPLLPASRLLPLLATLVLVLDLFLERLFVDHDSFALETVVLRLAWYVVVAAALDRRLVWREVLAWRPLRWLGLISYSLYLWHLPVFHLLDTDRYPNTPRSVLVVLRLVISFSAAALSYYLVEKPCIDFGRRLIRRRLDRRRAVAPLAVGDS